MHLVRLCLVFCQGAIAAAFGILNVDREAERDGLLLRCFRSREEFFRCCGRMAVHGVQLLAPPEGCFPEADRAFNATRLGRPRGKFGKGFRPPFGVYQKRLARCCSEPLRLHRKLYQQRASAAGAYPNWTVFKPDASMYVMNQPGVLELPAFAMQNLGAAGMSESFRSIQEALLRDLRGRGKQFKRNRELYRVGSAWGAKATFWDGEDFLPVFEALREKGVPMSFTLVDIGAAGGLDAQSPFVNLHNKYGDKVKGLAFEGNPELCAEHRAALPSLVLNCGWLRPSTLDAGLPAAEAWAPECGGEAEARCVDVWKVDIDSTDCTVVEVLLQNSHANVLPKVIILEVNPTFPPPIRFSMVSMQPPEDGEGSGERLRRGLYGCSLSHQAALLERFGYWLVGFGHKDAIYAHRSLAPLLSFSEPLDEFMAFATSVVMTYDATPPGLIRDWFYARPHDGIAMVGAYLSTARQGLGQELAVSLSL